jgi:CheY-like chemotaxis protein/CHASE3 domain sensor protein/HPt (histidine-containing phosphotransfer) domain-containing protein
MNTDIDWPASAGALALRERRTGLTVGGGIAAGLAIVIGIMFLVYTWTKATNDAETRLTQTRDASATLDEVCSAINDLDRTNTRYLLTGAPRYLSARDADAAAIDDGLPRLRAHLADDSAQSERLTELQPLITDFFSRLRAAGTTPSAARTFETDATVDEISSRFAEMHLEEGRLLMQRYADLEHSIDGQPSDFLGLLVLASATLCVFYTVAIVHLRRRGNSGNTLQDVRRRADAERSRDDALTDRIRSDIRSALTAIIGFCDLPLESGTPTNDRFDSIRRQAQQIVDAVGGTNNAHVIAAAAPVAPEVPNPDSFVTDTLSTGDQTLPVSPDPQPEARHFAGRVLLAEDSPDLQKVIKFYLESVGAEVTIVPDGKLACDHALVAWKQEKPFDLILMDIQMPNFDGRAATILLRDAGYTNPIVALTANATDPERGRCFAAGCNGFLAKPVDQEEFRQTMKRYLQPNSPSHAAPVGEEPAPSADAQFIALRESFEAEIPSRIADIETAVVEGNFAHVVYLTHQLKGTAGCFGLSAVCDAAAGLETAAENPDLRQNVQQCFKVLSELGLQPAAAQAA